MKKRVNEGMKELKDSRNNSDYQKENLKKYDSRKPEDHIAENRESTSMKGFGLRKGKVF